MTFTVAPAEGSEEHMALGGRAPAQPPSTELSWGVTSRLFNG